MFLGPTGVGKTELTLRFTEDLIGPGRVVHLDISEYQTADRLALLLGTSEGEPGRIAKGFDTCAGHGTLLFDESKWRIRAFNYGAKSGARFFGLVCGPHE